MKANKDQQTGRRSLTQQDAVSANWTHHEPGCECRTCRRLRRRDAARRARHQATPREEEA